MNTHFLNTLIGKRVVVAASDMTYRGVLIEVSEESVELQGESQWISIPVDRINSVIEEK